MRYLNDEESKKISYLVEVRPFSEGYRIKEFTCGNATYNKFLKQKSSSYGEMGISQTHLLINKANGDVIGYMTLSSDSIKLSEEEKTNDNMGEIRFNAIPALKIGQLATSIKYKSTGLHYGSFLIEIAIAMVYKLNELGVACRYLNVDADISEKDKKAHDVTYFYLKNGFRTNKDVEYKNKNTVSMRYDVFSEDSNEEYQETEQQIASDKSKNNNKDSNN